MDRLLSLLREHAFRRGTFTLSSGRQSDFFIDCKPVVLSAEGHVLVGEALLTAIDSFDGAHAVAGVELGGCPLASAVATLSWQRSQPLNALYVRKQEKAHGSKKAIEGTALVPAGAKVVVVEDTTTTGGSTLRAVESLRAAGYTPIGVVAVVDRNEGAREAFDAARLPFKALYTRSDFMEPG